MSELFKLIPKPSLAGKMKKASAEVRRWNETRDKRLAKQRAATAALKAQRG
jgi:hypothetical protein